MKPEAECVGSSNEIRQACGTRGISPTDNDHQDRYDEDAAESGIPLRMTASGDGVFDRGCIGGPYRQPIRLR